MTFLAAIVLIILVVSKSHQQTFGKITVREFELVDKNGVECASIKTEDDGEVTFRLGDGKGTIRLKMGAGVDGSDLVLLDSNTDPGIHVLSKRSGSSITVLGKDGKKKEY